MRTPLKIFKKSVKVLFLNLIIIILGLVLLEVIVRKFFPQPTYAYPQHTFKSDPNIGYRLTPNFTGKHCQLDFCVELKFNSLGLRDEEFNINEKYDYTILVLGDSIAFGNGVEFKDISLKILESKLKNEFSDKKIRVLKAGVPGHRTINEFLYFKYFGYKFKADLVVTLFAHNDLLQNISKDYYKVVNGYLVRQSFDRISRIRLFLNNKSQLYCFLKKKIFNNREIKDLFKRIFYRLRLNKDTLDNAKLEEAFKITEDYVFRLDKAIKEQASRHILILTPEVQYNINERIVRFCRQNNIDVFDTTSDFFDYANRYRKELHFKHDPHFNVEGNRVFAEILYEFLKDKVVLE